MAIRGNTQSFTPQREQILEALKRCHITFYLTGSRHFGYHDEKSDIDFFVKDNKDVRDFLEGLGFQYLPESSYTDQLSNRVYRHQCGVDVQLVTSTSIKAAAQTIIGHMYGKVRPPKGDQRRLWNSAIAAAKECSRC